MTEKYLILKRGPERVSFGTDADLFDAWIDLGEVEASYADKAAELAAGQHGEGEYMIVCVASTFGSKRFTVTARTEYDVERVEQKPSLEEIVERAA